MALPLGSLSSPSRLLAELGKEKAADGVPAPEELLESVQRRQGGAAPPNAADRLEVFPEPGFVVKTVNEQGQKVFVNVVGSGKLPLPPGWARGGGEVPAEVKRHLEERRGGEAPLSMRFPVCLGAVRIDRDHKGEACLVADCVVSTHLLAACASYRPLKLFLIELVLGLAEEKTGLVLDPQYRLPKMRYKGEGGPPPQFIRLDPKLAAGGSSSDALGGPAGSLSEGTAPAGSQAPAVAAGAGLAEQPGATGRGSGASQRPLISEVGQTEGEEEEAPAFALLASKRRQRQAGAAGAAPAASNGQQQQQPAAAVVGAAAAGQMPAAGQQQEQQLHAQVEFVGKPASAVQITVPLPPGAAVAAQLDTASLLASVGGSSDVVRLAVPGCQPLEVRLPFGVSAADGRAELVAGEASGSAGSSSGGASLVLHLPYRPFGSMLQELRQAALAAKEAAAAGAGGEGRRIEIGAGGDSGLMDID